MKYLAWESVINSLAWAERGNCEPKKHRMCNPLVIVPFPVSKWWLG